MRAHTFPPCGIYNMDETRIQTVPGKLCIVVSTKGKRNGTNNFDCLCNEFNYSLFTPSPYFCTECQNYALTCVAPPGSVSIVSNRSDITVYVFIKWLIRFKINAIPKEVNLILLISDHRMSRISSEAITFAKENKFHLLSLPPYSSQKATKRLCQFKPIYLRKRVHSHFSNSNDTPDSELRILKVRHNDDILIRRPAQQCLVFYRPSFHCLAKKTGAKRLCVPLGFGGMPWFWQKIQNKKRFITTKRGGGRSKKGVWRMEELAGGAKEEENRHQKLPSSGNGSQRNVRRGKEAKETDDSSKGWGCDSVREAADRNETASRANIRLVDKPGNPVTGVSLGEGYENTTPERILSYHLQVVMNVILAPIRSNIKWQN
ncbi:hypothetical protein PR048_024994 [Dryococelus australis]|uniref:Transposase n=1 Tax=Dryococelus australis TaxID=614101 RepID=A0ABQ9GQ42_9NEOP|nr:hypothetical protein PR048_024994 [Dryococelus australis]